MPYQKMYSYTVHIHFYCTFSFYFIIDFRMYERMIVIGSVQCILLYAQQLSNVLTAHPHTYAQSVYEAKHVLHSTTYIAYIVHVHIVDVLCGECARALHNNFINENDTVWCLQIYASAVRCASMLRSGHTLHLLLVVTARITFHRDDKRISYMFVVLSCTILSMPMYDCM